MAAKVFYCVVLLNARKGYRIFSNRSRGLYLFFLFFSAASIRGRLLFTAIVFWLFFHSCFFVVLWQWQKRGKESVMILNSKTAAYIWGRLVLTIFHLTCGLYLREASIWENTVYKFHSNISCYNSFIYPKMNWQFFVHEKLV